MAGFAGDRTSLSLDKRMKKHDNELEEPGEECTHGMEKSIAMGKMLKQKHIPQLGMREGMGEVVLLLQKHLICSSN